MTAAVVGFERIFGAAPAVVASAPGRVNLLGEHTDYNDGLVLPAAIPQRTEVALLRGAGPRARVASAQSGTDGAAWREYRVGGEARGQGWLDYVQGVTFALGGAGHAPGGFDAFIASDVPLGSGLSSSAALAIAFLRALRDAFALDLDDWALARIAHTAEHDFVGAPIGLLDQLACSFADTTHALFLDTRSLAHERVALPAGIELVVINSGIAHENANGDYRTRREECARAAAALGVSTLRDVVDADVARALPEPLGRRVRHVVTENARVLEGVAALRSGDVRRLGRLFAESHASMRDDYEVSVPDIDTLVSLAARDVAVHGARLTGGGFGGSIVAVTDAGAGRGAAERIVRAYGVETKRTAVVLVPTLGDG